MIITKSYRPIQYGFGLKYKRDMRGNGIGPWPSSTLFDSLKKYGLPAKRFFGTLIKNNLPEILGITKNIIGKHDKRPTIKQVIQDIKTDPLTEKIKQKSLSQHFRGEGLDKKSKDIIKRLQQGGGLKILNK